MFTPLIYNSYHEISTIILVVVNLDAGRNANLSLRLCDKLQTFLTMRRTPRTLGSCQFTPRHGNVYLSEYLGLSFLCRALIIQIHGSMFEGRLSKLEMFMVRLATGIRTE